jgi:murein DD-endopeptidase MepM/ murein hydrolase activator NlpD
VENNPLRYIDPTGLILEGFGDYSEDEVESILGLLDMPEKQIRWSLALHGDQDHSYRINDSTDDIFQFVTGVENLNFEQDEQHGYSEYLEVFPNASIPSAEDITDAGYIYPIDSGRISSLTGEYGPRRRRKYHQGMDFTSLDGDVQMAKSGTVIGILPLVLADLTGNERLPRHGNRVLVQFNDGLIGDYSHSEFADLEVGASYYQGRTMGYQSNSSSIPNMPDHLHYQMRINTSGRELSMIEAMSMPNVDSVLSTLGAPPSSINFNTLYLEKINGTWQNKVR